MKYSLMQMNKMTCIKKDLTLESKKFIETSIKDFGIK